MYRIIFAYCILCLLFCSSVTGSVPNYYQSCGIPTQVRYSFAPTDYSQDILGDLGLGKLSDYEKDVITNPSSFKTIVIVDTLCDSVDDINITVEKLAAIRSTNLFTDQSYQIISITDGNSYSVLSGKDDRKEVLQFCQQIFLDVAYDSSFSLLPSFHCFMDSISNIIQTEQQQQQEQEQQLIFVSSNGLSLKLQSETENNYDIIKILDSSHTFWIIEDASEENMNVIQGISGSEPFVDFYVLPQKTGQSITNELIKSYIINILLDISSFRGDIFKDIAGPILCDETCYVKDTGNDSELIGLVNWELECKNIPSLNTIHSYEKASSLTITEEQCKSPELLGKLGKTLNILDSSSNTREEKGEDNYDDSSKINRETNDSSFFDEEMITMELERYNLVSVRTYHGLPSNDNSGNGIGGKTGLLTTDITVNEFEICVADDNNDVNPVTIIGFSDNMDGNHFQASFTSENLASSSAKWRLFGNNICASFTFESLQYYSSLSSIDNSEFWILVSTPSYDNKVLVQFTDNNKGPIELVINPLSQPIIDLYVIQPKVSLVTYSENVYVKFEAFVSIEQDEQKTGLGGYELETVKELFWENRGDIPFHLSYRSDNIKQQQQHYSSPNERMNNANVEWNYALDYIDVIPIERECLDSRDLYFISFIMKSSDTIGVMKFEESLHLRVDITNNINAQWIQQQHLYFNINLFLLKQSDIHIDRWVGYNLELFKDKSLTQHISSIKDIKDDSISKSATIYGKATINNPLYQLKLEHLLLCSSARGQMKSFDPFYAHSTGCDTRDNLGIDRVVTKKHAYGEGAVLKESKGFFSLLDQQVDSFTFKIIVPTDGDVLLRVDWEVIPIIGAGFTKNDEQDRLFSDSIDNPSFLVDHHFSGSEFSLLESQVHKILHDHKLFLMTFPFSYNRSVYSPHFSSQLQKIDDSLSSSPKNTITTTTDNRKSSQSNKNDNLGYITDTYSVNTSPDSIVNTGDQLLQDHKWNTVQHLQLFVQQNDVIPWNDFQNDTIFFEKRNQEHWNNDDEDNDRNDDCDNNHNDNDDDDDNCNNDDDDDDDDDIFTFTRGSGSKNSRDKHLFLMMLIFLLIIFIIICISGVSCLYYCWWVDDTEQVKIASFVATEKVSKVITKEPKKTRKRRTADPTNSVKKITGRTGTGLNV